MTQPHDYALYERIYLAVEQIPRGMVATYGDIAAIVGGGCDARTVGYALGALPEGRQVPWQRVINREGGISTRGLLQHQLLADEGVVFDERDRVILARHRWPGPTAEWAATHGFHILPPRADAEQLGMF